MAKYDQIILGNGVASTTHGDYANTKVIIPRIKDLNPNCEIFGYVTANQTNGNFENGVNEWIENVDFGALIDGIFFDEAGYDFNVTRESFNYKIDFVHSKDVMCFINAWNIDDVLGDASHVLNPNSLKSNLLSSDWYLFESLAYGPYGSDNALQFENDVEWKTRGDKVEEYFDLINMAVVCQIGDDDSNGQNIFNFIQTSALMLGLDSMGTSDKSYGASSAKAKFWDRLGDLTSLVVVFVSDTKYRSHFTGGQMDLDFDAKTSSIMIY